MNKEIYTVKLHDNREISGDGDVLNHLISAYTYAEKWARGCGDEWLRKQFEINSTLIYRGLKANGYYDVGQSNEETEG